MSANLADILVTFVVAQIPMLAFGLMVYLQMKAMKETINEVVLSQDQHVKDSMDLSIKLQQEAASRVINFTKPMPPPPQPIHPAYQQIANEARQQPGPQVRAPQKENGVFPSSPEPISGLTPNRK